MSTIISLSFFTFICTQSTNTDPYYLAITGDRESNNTQIVDPIKVAFESLQLNDYLTTNSRSGFEEHEPDLTVWTIAVWTDFTFAPNKTLSIDSGLDAFTTYFQTFDETVNVYGKMVLCKECHGNGEYSHYSHGVDDIFVPFAPVQIALDLTDHSILYGTQTENYINIYISTWWVFKDGTEAYINNKRDELWTHRESFSTTSILTRDDDIIGEWFDITLHYNDLHSVFLDFNKPLNWSNTYDLYYECSGTEYCFWIYKVHMFCSNEAFCSEYLRMNNANDTETTLISSTAQSGTDKKSDEQNKISTAIFVVVIILLLIWIAIGWVYLLRKKKKHAQMLYQPLSPSDNQL